MRLRVHSLVVGKFGACGFSFSLYAVFESHMLICANILIIQSRPTSLGRMYARCLKILT